jgi:hypothetical protein
MAHVALKRILGLIVSNIKRKIAMLRNDLEKHRIVLVGSGMSFQEGCLILSADFNC